MGLSKVFQKEVMINMHFEHCHRLDNDVIINRRKGKCVMPKQPICDGCVLYNLFKKKGLK